MELFSAKNVEKVYGVAEHLGQRALLGDFI